MPKDNQPLPDETYENGEGPRCPFCNDVMTADEPEYFDEDGFDTECGACGSDIRIVPSISVSWVTKPIKRADDT